MRTRNHFSKFCPKKHSKVQTLNHREDDYDYSELTQDEAWLGAVQNTGCSTICAKMLVNDCNVNFEIDSDKGGRGGGGQKCSKIA